MKQKRKIRTLSLAISTEPIIYTYMISMILSYKRIGQELAEWSTDNDALFLLDDTCVLICIPKKEALMNKLIEA